MKSYLKTTAGVVLSATMATASYGATVNVGELQGFTGPLEVVNRGWGMDRFVAYLYETYGARTKDRQATMTLLMDWDRTGGRLQTNLRRRLESFDVQIDEDLRRVLMKTLKPETRVVESLGGLAGALMPHMGVDEPLTYDS